MSLGQPVNERGFLFLCLFAETFESPKAQIPRKPNDQISGESNNANNRVS